MDFTHYTDESVSWAVELVNTFDPADGEDSLATPDDLRRFLGKRLDADWSVGEDDLEEVRRLRSQLREVFEAHDEERAAALVNDILEDVRAVPRVSLHQGGPHLHFEPLGTGPGRWLGAATAMGLAVVLCEGGMERLGVCEATGCRDVYVDVSRNRSRRYCGERCTTRESVAAYRRRHQAMSD